MKILRLIADGLTSAPMLIVLALGLIGLSWGWAGGWVSIFWGIVLVAVLIGELGNKLWSPRKKTVSSNIREEVKKGGWRIWTMLGLWLYFAVTLFLHFIKPILLGG
jgi:hypothetical protein